MPDARLTNHQKGVLGEVEAERLLTQNGMQCLDRRYHSPCGEIDLIMLDKETLVFVEVKARTFRTLSEAQNAVSPSKQRKIIQTALYYLNEHPEHADRLMRFDVVSISGSFVHHIPNAFQGYGW